MGQFNKNFLHINAFLVSNNKSWRVVVGGIEALYVHTSWETEYKGTLFPMYVSIWTEEYLSWYTMPLKVSYDTVGKISGCSGVESIS